ncbi:hypothetical protein POM88_048426 [Heracleum sosnowskyi]|uniref:Helitron helicase-like domain-containing protein n=1 Tax=Heracleum sosnowskyi TaxID=360622 RepID=A0AAD8LYG5_9APIA|nr:hypothetical protein POM88_048426 [Heracleum sosnowskyi]
MKASCNDSTVPLLCNVFHYDVGMMKENVDPFEGIDAVSETTSKRVMLDEKVGFAKRLRQHKTGEPICANFLNMMDTKKRINLQNILPRRPHTPLLFDVFNYDLSMMKDNLYPKKKKVQVSKRGTNKENVDPEDQMGAQKLKTPQSAKRYSPQSPLSTLSNDCQATSRIPKKIRVLNCKKKNMDSTIPETPNSTLTSMFNSNVKESGLEENRFSLNCCNSTVQTLDFGMNTEFSESHRTVDEIDFSRVVGFEADEPDMFSEDEDIEDLDCWSHDNLQKAENVPCDYASLGPPEVKCDKYDIKKKSYFGTCFGVMYVVEFQKRGLPHVHMLIWLDSTAKNDLKKNVDKYVSAEIPHPDIDHVGYAAVKAFMIHGPCGSDNPKASCMKQFKCIRHFPKNYSPSTTFDESGFPLYKRRNNGVTVNIRKQDLDNKNS